MNEQEAKAYKELSEYYGINSKFHLRLKFGKSWILQEIASKLPVPGAIAALHRMRGVKVGKDVFIGPDVHLELLYPHLITIQDNASIGMRTMVFAHASHWSPFLGEIYPRKVAPVVIGKGAWIAPGCIILSGVTIGENSVVGAGSVVIQNVEPYTIVAGNPARLLKTIDH
jgi:acetyltransferase-like isoleucine patch superfamily enzyme